MPTAPSPTTITATGAPAKSRKKKSARRAATNDPLALIGKFALADVLAVDKWTLDRWRKKDSSFPQPVWISGSTPRWKRTEIERWLATRPSGGRAPNWDAKPSHKKKSKRTVRRPSAERAA
jgi:predicted DNA-binding transcriptional regulator AlpA